MWRAVKNWIAVSLLLAGVVYASGAVGIQGAGVTAASVLAALTGQTIVSTKYTSSQTSGNCAISTSTGARWCSVDSGAGTCYYDGSGTLTCLLGGIYTTGPLNSASTKTAGTLSLSTGTATVTVVAGSHCVCNDVTAATVLPCKMTVSSTIATATVTGGGSDNVSYVCL